MKDIYSQKYKLYTMKSSDINNYDIKPVFDNKNNNQEIEIYSKENEKNIGTIEIIENDNMYHLIAKREDLEDNVAMGVVKEKENIGVELAHIVRKLIHC